MEKNNISSKIDLLPYKGQWIVICKNKVIAHNKDLARITDEIKKCKITPTIAKIPKKDTLIF